MPLMPLSIQGSPCVVIEVVQNSADSFICSCPLKPCHTALAHIYHTYTQPKCSVSNVNMAEAWLRSFAQQKKSKTSFTLHSHNMWQWWCNTEILWPWWHGGWGVWWSAVFHGLCRWEPKSSGLGTRSTAETETETETSVARAQKRNIALPNQWSQLPAWQSWKLVIFIYVAWAGQV